MSTNLTDKQRQAMEFLAARQIFVFRFHHALHPRHLAVVKSIARSGQAGNNGDVRVLTITPRSRYLLLS
jgi:hypothetical protein